MQFKIMVIQNTESEIKIINIHHSIYNNEHANKACRTTTTKNNYDIL